MEDNGDGFTRPDQTADPDVLEKLEAKEAERPKLWYLSINLSLLETLYIN